MVLFGSLLDQYVNRFARANVLSIFEFDADVSIDFLTRILINGLRDIFLVLNFIRIQDQDYVGVDDNNLEY